MSFQTLLNSLEAVNEAKTAFVGLDGFVDEVVHVVKTRHDAGNYERISTLKEYGEKIASASGLSLNVEIETVAKKLGGNGPIFALGLMKFGMSLVYMGCTGEEGPDPVFHELAEGAEIIGVADPGRTDAMEFDDGKIIRSKLSSLNGLTWERIMAKTTVERLAAYMDGAKLISFNNWTMIPRMSEIWRRILDDAVPRMRKPPNGKILFFDLADPEKRKKEDILGALELIREFQGKGFDTVLGLNRKEACEILEIIRGVKISDYSAISLDELCRDIAAYMRISCLAVHPVENAACVMGGVYSAVNGPYCAKPKLTTGAGDNFNAGFMFGYINGFSAEDCLLLGTAASGYYVRSAKSASRPEIIGFIGDWSKGALDS